VDASGAPLEDLTAGVYTLQVSAFYGNTVLQTETMTLHFAPMFKLFGAFQPDSDRSPHHSRFMDYATTNNYRVFLDPFAGYFFPEGFYAGNYRIDRRWRPQNSLEVVNTIEGVTYGTADNAQIGYILYNLIETGPTSRLEIGKALLTEVIDSPNTHFFRYDIGEPKITYTTMTSEVQVIDGSIVPMEHGDRLALTRAEMKIIGTGDGDNRYNLYGTTPTTLDLDIGDGIRVAIDEEFSVFGVVTPIPASVTEASYLYYKADNRISRVRYRIMDAQESEVAQTTRDLNLGRVYIESDPDRLFHSIFEFEHEFDLNAMAIVPGQYIFHLIALDENGDEISGTEETFVVEYG
jgi:hypothetical protein